MVSDTTSNSFSWRRRSGPPCRRVRGTRGGRRRAERVEELVALPVLRAIEVQLGDAVDVGGLLGERATRLAQVPESVRPDHVASDAPHVMVGVGVDHVPTAANHIVDVVDLQCEVVGERQRRRLVGCSLHDVGVVRWPHRLSGEHAVGGDVDALGRFARPVERVLGRWSRVPRNDGDLDAQTRLRFPQHQVQAWAR